MLTYSLNWGKSPELASSQNMLELDQKIGLSQVFKIEKMRLHCKYASALINFKLVSFESGH